MIYKSFMGQCKTSVPVVCLLLLSCNSNKNEKEADSNLKPETILQKADTSQIIFKQKAGIDSIKISAKDLTAAYVANEVKADSDFKGKIISVTGVVQDIKKGIAD